jgi:xylulokinase
MHGLVCVDKDNNVLRPSIIWCDSRAAAIGDKAFDTLGGEKCLSALLNSPGNFTASKLMWVKENEPEVYAKIDKIMLPGDYIALRLTEKQGQQFRLIGRYVLGFQKQISFFNVDGLLWFQQFSDT